MEIKIHGMTFEEAVVAFGYGKAVVMFKEHLPISFWEDMDIQQQVLVYIASSSAVSNELAEKIFYKLASTPIGFLGWREIYYWATPNNDLQALARAKMVELASTLEHWQIVYNLSPPDGDHKKIACEKIGQLTRQEMESVD